MGLSNGLAEILAEKMPWIVFRLEDAYYAVSSRYVSAIGLLEMGYAPVPESRPYIRGVMPFRGKTVEVLDLRVFLGHSSLRSAFDASDDSLNELMLVLDYQEISLALAVDQIIGVQDIQPLSDENVSEILDSGLAVGIAKTSGLEKVVLLLDDQRILNRLHG